MLLLKPRTAITKIQNWLSVSPLEDCDLQTTKKENFLVPLKSKSNSAIFLEIDK